MYEVHLSQRANDYLKKLDFHIRSIIMDRLKELSIDPYPRRSKFLTNQKEKILRYKIGRHRALYKVKENEKIVLVTKIDKRSRVYRKNSE